VTHATAAQPMGAGSPATNRQTKKRR
jgi:hypothetical protein